jgi:hypothetical protein
MGIDQKTSDETINISLTQAERRAADHTPSVLAGNFDGWKRREGG